MIWYFNFKTSPKTWDHLSDDHFRSLIEAEKRKRDTNFVPKATISKKEDSQVTIRGPSVEK